jgi:beta-glucosidase
MRVKRLFAVGAVLLSGSAMAQTNPAVYQDATQPAAIRAHDLVSRMTVEEKASQLEDYATAIPRLGVPDYQTWSEALHGVANSGYATVFPQAIGMGATWDPALVHTMGDIISTEGRSKFNQAQREDNHRIFYGLTFWSPNINIFRDPRWGRGQETYGEDPFLTGKMGTAFIEGVQGDDPDHPKAVATSKHFAVHSGPESTRHTANVDVSPRDLEETYLPAFRATVIDGHVKSVMCAYNAIDGMSACANTMLLKDHLRDAWGFKGFVVSDCAAIMDVTNGHKNAPDILHAAAISIKAGTDLSCSIWAPGFNTLADAVKQNVVSEALLTQSAERLYTARFQLGMFDKPGMNPNDSIPFTETASEPHRQVALKAAQESMVLLKNSGVLPLKAGTQSIAVVGPTAALLPSLEGNYNGVSVNAVYPVDGIAKQFPGAAIHYAQGATLASGFSVPVPRTSFGAGLKAEYFADADWTGRPVAQRVEADIQHNWRDAAPVPEIETHDYSVRWTGTFRVPAPGKYSFLVQGGENFPYSPNEAYSLSIDGKTLGEASTNVEGLSPAKGASPTAPPVAKSAKPLRIEMTFEDTNLHVFEMKYSHSGDRTGGGVTLRWEAPAAAQLNEAVAAANASDVVVAFVGLSPQLEGEEMPVKMEGFNGGDRTSISLPRAQQDLLEAVAATGKPVIVVSLTGSAFALTWAKEHAAAAIQAWYPGVEGGTAIAQTLAGQNNPSGRLPLTFYATVDDLPPFADYTMKNRTYRYYTGKPLWGFGYGLSYTTFKYGPVQLSSPSVKAGEPLTATVSVTNNGSVAGDEVVEAYVKTPQKGGPLHALAGFERVHLAPGESRSVTIEIPARSLSSVDDAGQRSILAGSYKLSIGGAQPGETMSKSEATFAMTGTVALPK